MRNNPFNKTHRIRRSRGDMNNIVVGATSSSSSDDSNNNDAQNNSTPTNNNNNNNTTGISNDDSHNNISFHSTTPIMNGESNNSGGAFDTNPILPPIPVQRSNSFNSTATGRSSTSIIFENNSHDINGSFQESEAEVVIEDENPFSSSFITNNNNNTNDDNNNTNSGGIPRVISTENIANVLSDHEKQQQGNNNGNNNDDDDGFNAFDDSEIPPPPMANSDGHHNGCDDSSGRSFDVFNNESFRSYEYQRNLYGNMKNNDKKNNAMMMPPPPPSIIDESTHDISGVELSYNADAYQNRRNSKIQNTSKYHCKNVFEKMKQRRRLLCLIGTVFVLLIALTSVLVIFYGGGGKGNDNTNKSSNSIDDNSTSIDELNNRNSLLSNEIINKLTLYTDRTILDDKTTPQGKALTQLLYEVTSTVIAKTEDHDGATISPILYQSPVSPDDNNNNNNGDVVELKINNLRLYQRYALMVLYYSTSSSQWKDSHGWDTFTYDECNWFGNTCRLIVDDNINNNQDHHNSDHHTTGPVTSGGGTTSVAEKRGGITTGSSSYTNSAVTQIQLNSNGLIGSIPNEICALSDYVEVINLSDNELGGSMIPSCIFNKFIYLEKLNLSGCNIHGISSTNTAFKHKGILAMNSKLKELNLSKNKLSMNIDELLFHNEDQSGGQQDNNNNQEDQQDNNDDTNTGIETSLSRAQSEGPLHLQINELLLDNNNLKGTIPNTFDKLPNLQYLSLHNNDETYGTIPSKIGICNLIFKKLKIFSYNKKNIDCECCSIQQS